MRSVTGERSAFDRIFRRLAFMILPLDELDLAVLFVCDILNTVEDAISRCHCNDCSLRHYFNETLSTFF